MIKNSSVNAGNSGDTCLISASGRDPGGEHGNPLQYPCLENSMDRGAWGATVHEVTKELDTTEQLNISCISEILDLGNDITPMVQGGGKKLRFRHLCKTIQIFVDGI